MSAGIPALVLALLFIAVGVASYFKGKTKYGRPGPGFFASAGLIGSMVMTSATSFGSDMPADRVTFFTIFTVVVALVTVWFIYDAVFWYRRFRKEDAKYNAMAKRIVDDIMNDMG